MLALLKQLIVGTLALGALASSVGAQCLFPDNLDGGACCTRTFETLPQFPNIQQQILDICWRDCQVDQVLSYTASWSQLQYLYAQPGSQHCGEHTSLLIIRDSSNLIAYIGNMRLQYSRTWVEAGPSPVLIQVWRFLVNGDLYAFNAAGPSPCPRPPCAASFGKRIRYTGYIDYSFDCGTNSFSAAWMLTHACDTIDHAPGFPRSGVFHPDRAYTFVGPSAGFVVNPLVPVENGPITDAAIRRSQLPPFGSNLPIDCMYEEHWNGGLVTLNQTFCFCGQSTSPQQYADSGLSALGYCGSSVAPLGTPPIPGFLSMGIGSWTNPNVFPGVEDVRWNCGSYSFFDPCTLLTGSEFFFGVTTLGGDMAYDFNSGGVGFPLDLVFIDQSNSVRFKNQSLLRNVPYISDHFLNLNVP